MNRSCFQLRSASLAVAVLAVAAAGVFFELTIRPGGILTGVHAGGSNDLTTHFLRAQDASRLLSEQVDGRANWDPHLGLGMPMHGNPQLALAYPPNWIAQVVGAERSLSWIMIGHLWFAGCGAFVLARQAGYCWASGVLAGVVSLAAPYSVAHMAEGHYAQICTVAWVPWILFAFERFLGSDGRRWKVLSVTLGLCFLAGHVQELYYLVLMLTGVLTFDVVQRLRTGNRRPAISLVVHWGLAAVVTGGLVAVDLLPVWLNTQLTARGSRLPIDVAGAGLRIENLRQLVNPLSLGGPDRAGNPQDFYWTSLLYFGVLPLISAVVGAVLPDTSRSGTAGSGLSGTADLMQRPRSLSRRMLWLTVVSLLFAFGNATPLFGLCYRLLPVIGSFRIPARVLFLTSFFVAMLAASGLHTLIARRRAEAGDLSGTVPTVRMSPVGIAVGLLLIAGSAAELGWHARQVIAVAPQDQYRRQSELTRFLEERIGHHRLLVPLAEFSDHESLRNRIARVRGYEPVLQRRLVWLIDALFDVPDGQLDFAGFHETDLRTVRKSVADLAGIRYFGTTVRQPAREGWKPVKTVSVPPLVSLSDDAQDRKPVFLYENVSVMPRAFVVGDVVTQDDRGGQAIVDQLELLDPRQAVLLENDILEPGERSDLVPAEITEYLPDRVTIRTDSRKPGYLVLTDLFHPGWSATVDGRPVPVLPANLAFRAVPVASGRHEVQFRYECPGQANGLLLTVATLALLTAAAFIDWRRAAKPNSAPPSGDGD